MLAVGVASFLSAQVRSYLKMLPVFNAKVWGVIMLGLGIMFGGIGYGTGLFNTASVSGDDNVVGTAGGLDLKIHDGLANATTTEDYYNDEDTFLTFYSADASIVDGEEYSWNITIDRELAAEDAVIKVECTIPDKEISGVTADSIAEKTGGQVDLDINDGGRHSSDTSVYKSFSMAEGTITQEVQVAFDQEETYHDGMTDLDDYVDIVCVVSSDDGASSSVTTRIYADN